MDQKIKITLTSEEFAGVLCLCAMWQMMPSELIVSMVSADLASMGLLEAESKLYDNFPSVPDLDDAHVKE
jgi:hypothetical protein